MPNTDSVTRMPMALRAAAASDIGRHRPGNEDAHCVRQDLGLFVVADGMGGHAAGEVASTLATVAIESFVDDTRDRDLDRTWPFPYEADLTLDGNRLKAGCRLANRRIADAMRQRDDVRGMATTAVALLVTDDQPAVAHVGDSRLYLWREAQLHQLTQDHSWVGEQVRAGILTDVNARQHPWRNVVTRTLAGGDDPGIDVATVSVRAGDRLILCTDGLCGVVTSEDLASVLAKQLPLDRSCAALIDAANAAGGPDNITVIIVEIGPDDV